MFALLPSVSVTLSAIALFANATVVLASYKGPESMSNREWEKLWSGVLSRHVDGLGRIDFLAV